MEDEAFPTEEVSQSLTHSHSLANGICHYSWISRDTSPTCKISTLMVLDLEGSSWNPPQNFSLLSNIYEICTFALFGVDSSSFQEASTKMEWRCAV